MPTGVYIRVSKKVKRSCGFCKKEMLKRSSDIKWGHGKYCSQSCRAKDQSVFQKGHKINTGIIRSAEVRKKMREDYRGKCKKCHRKYDYEKHGVPNLHFSKKISEEINKL